ncbi:MAG: 3'-5' exonuclease [Clostridia bacterium]|nr:3'-5' exonuclease [Clostridia bacterium]
MSSLFSIFDSVIFLDTETTGLDSKNDKLIEIAAIKVILEEGKLKIAKDFDYFIKLPDGMVLSEEITELTGITNEDLSKKGESSSYVAKQFVSLFEGEKSLLVAYNAQFDLSFIYWLLVNENLAHLLKGIKMLDALTVYKDRKSYPHKLANAVQAYDLSDIVANTHRAIDDTMSLFEVVKAMCYESDDLDKYINLFGYNPKYGVNGSKIQSVRYLPQPYNSWKKLYEE